MGLSKITNPSFIYGIFTYFTSTEMQQCSKYVYWHFENEIVLIFTFFPHTYKTLQGFKVV